MAESITGVKELDQKLKRLKDKVQTKVMKAALRSSLGVAVKEIRKEIPPKYKHVRKSMGYRMGKSKRTGLFEAKLGWRIGRAARKNQDIPDRGGRAGVGLAGQNWHWYILGTKERFHKSGKSVGSFGPKDRDMIPRGMKRAERPMVAKMAERLRVGINREALKK